MSNSIARREPTAEENENRPTLTWAYFCPCCPSNDYWECGVLINWDKTGLKYGTCPSHWADTECVVLFPDRGEGEGLYYLLPPYNTIQPFTSFAEWVHKVREAHK